MGGEAAGMAAEAAENLDALNTPGGKSARKKRKSKKARKTGKLREGAKTKGAGTAGFDAAGRAYKVTSRKS